MVSAAQVGSRLFVDSYQRSKRLQTALDSRGYDGELRVLPSNYQRNNALFLVWLAVIASLFLVWRLL